jgi:hypothetical protein
MKKTILLFACFASLQLAASAQNNTQLIMDFDGTEKGNFVYSDGFLDTNYDNPDTTGENKSAKVALYERSSSAMEAVVVLNTSDVMRINAFTSNSPLAPKFRIKLWTEAPVGTIIQIQVGDIAIDTYPDGFHSTYEARTTTQSEWEDLVFSFVQLVPGGLTDTTKLDKIVFMFNPQSMTDDVYHFDSIVGPQFQDFTSINRLADAKIGLNQNFPNPVKSNTIINYSVKESGRVKLVLYNMVGQEVRSIANGMHSPGEYNVTVNTEGLTEGVYFYTLSIGNQKQTKKLTVLK